MSVTTWESVLTEPLSPDRDHVWGPADAPLTMVEYGDFECPFCRAAVPEVEAVLERAGDELAYAFRHFPITTAHPHALAAAEAAEAAGAQGRFWEMHQLLFADQAHLEEPHLVARADALGLDVQRFVDDLRRGAHSARVQRDFLSGVRSGVNGTPSFFLNGRRHDGPFDASSLLRSLAAAART